MRKLLQRGCVVLALNAALAFAAPLALAAASPGEVQSAVSDILTSGQRLPLPMERVKSALTAHYIKGASAPYWVGTGRMQQFLQRMQFAHGDDSSLTMGTTLAHNRRGVGSMDDCVGPIAAC